MGVHDRSAGRADPAASRSHEEQRRRAEQDGKRCDPEPGQTTVARQVCSRNSPRPALDATTER